MRLRFDFWHGLIAATSTLIARYVYVAGAPLIASVGIDPHQPALRFGVQFLIAALILGGALALRARLALAPDDDD
jgi:hypothetical protein